MIRSVAIASLLFFIVSEVHAQLLPTTVKKNTAHKTAPYAPKPKNSKSEPIKETTKTTTVQVEDKNEVKPQTLAEKKSVLKIISDANSTIYLNGEKVGTIKKDNYFNLLLSKGTFNIKVISDNFPIAESKELYYVDGSGSSDTWNIRMKNNEILYWGEELIKTIKPYIRVSSTTNTKINKPIVSYSATIETFKTQDSNIIIKYLTNSADDKKRIVNNSTLIYEKPIANITTYNFTLNEIKGNQPSLLLILKGNGTQEIIDNITKKRIVPGSESNAFIITVDNSSQKELEGKLSFLFKQKPF